MLYFLLVLVLQSCLGGRNKVITGLEGKPLPSFNMLLTDSLTHLNSNNIAEGKPFVIFYFNPSCPYCKAQTEEIRDNIKSLKNIELYFLCGFPLHQTKIFEANYSLSKFKNITVAQVYDSSFFKYYNIPVVPYIAIYDKQKKLKEVLIGKTNLDDIIEIAFQN